MEFNGRKQKGITTRYNDEILNTAQPSGIEENAFTFVPNWCNLFSTYALSFYTYSQIFSPFGHGRVHCKYLRPNYDGITVYHHTFTIFRCNFPLQLNIPIATIRYTKIYSDMIVKCE